MSKVLTKPETPPAERQRGIDRVVDVFEALLKARSPLRVGELARRLGAPRSSLYNLVNILVAADMLEFMDQDGAVFFGPAMHLYGTAYLETNPLQKRAREVLDRLAGEADATAQLCALRGDKYVVLDSRSGASLFRITTDIGVPVPLPWTASGRLLLDHMTPDAIRALIPPEDYRLPDGQSVDPERFLAEVSRARAEGSCITTSLSDRFTCCLAAPIRNARQQAVATVCFVIAAHQSDLHKERLMPLLLDAARLLGAGLQGEA